MIQLSDHFSYSRLIRFTMPTIIMTIISSIYGVVDGIMVSNFAGTTQFAALNLIWPFVMVLGAFGFMLGSGGSALVAKTLGEGDTDRARSTFSLITYFAIALAAILGVAGFLLTGTVARLLGAEGEILRLSCLYARIMLAFLPAFVLQCYFQYFMIAAERPKMGMWVTLSAGVANIVFDLIFIGIFHWGIAGAAIATVIGWLTGALIPLGFFIFRGHDSALRLSRCTIDLQALLKTCSNGISEFAINISLSLVGMLYIAKLLGQMGENGVAAYGIMMYFAYIFVAVFLGFGAGSAPVVSYHYGAGNRDELHGLYSKSIKMISLAAVCITVLAQVAAHPLSAIFVSYDPELLELTVGAFRIYSIHLLITGFNIYASAFFTALNNGPVSALISLLRTLVLETSCIIILPALFGIDAIWWAVTVAEGLTLIVSAILLLRYRKVYGY